MLSPLHQQLLNDFQQDFPLSPTPYLDIAQRFGISEAEVLTLFEELRDSKYISRIGPVIQPNCIGNSTLVAMAVAPDDLKSIAERISQYPEVNHNYERENRFNLWFVVIANDEAHLQSVIASIEKTTGYQTMQLPLLNDFFINLGFDLGFND